MKHALKGIATISVWAKDHEAAVAWYGGLFGMKPYFTRPGYAEFRIGDDETEVGIIDSAYAPEPVGSNAPAGIVAYWHVDDVKETFKRLLSLGAEQLEAPVDRGHGFVTASVVDPFGNILGVMYNPHYLEVRGSQKKIL